VILPPFTPITDAADPRIEPYRAVRDRDLAGRPGRFIAEGEVVLRTLLSGGSRAGVESVLLAQHRLQSVSGLLAGLPAGVPIYVADRVVMDAVVGFPIHRGVLAVGLAPPDDGPDAVLRPLPRRTLALGLVGISNHDNVGGAFRNAAAFGAGAVLLDPVSCSPLYRKAIRVSVGASLLVPYARCASEDAMVSALLAEGFVPFALSPSGAERIEDVIWPARTALLVGAEGPGLPAALLGRLRSVRIDMVEGFDSLNVAATTAVALHAARAGPRAD
jgi:tRNA G18 (ribose-2'-O)-methylase SpoU